MVEDVKSAVLKVGIVGMRSIGRAHGEGLAHIAADGEQVELVAFSGGTPEIARETGWPEAVQVSHEELLADPNIDVIALCSPTHLHGRQAIAVARSGRHVVVEKPLTLSIPEARELTQIQDGGGPVIAMIAQRRHESVIAKVKALLTQGELGQLRIVQTHVHWHRGEEYFSQAPWRAQSEFGGGSLVNQGVHNLDLFQWLGGPITSVTAQYGVLEGYSDREDTVVATVAFESGALGMISTSTAAPPGFGATLTIHTDRGRVVLGDGEILSWDFDHLDAPTSDGPQSSGASDPAAIQSSGHAAAWQEIIDAIRQGRAPLIDAHEGAKVTTLFNAIYQAADTGQRVVLAEM